MKYEPVRGMRDILPDEVHTWRLIEETFREVARFYNYREIRFPLLEATELFTRGIGESTDVVGKQMYTFPDRKGRSLTLRPEGTASAARAYLTAGLQVDDPFQKWFYIGPMFRYEKMQRGRYRQFSQIGIELLGAATPQADVEVLLALHTFLRNLGFNDLVIVLNNLGDPEDRDRLFSCWKPCDHRQDVVLQRLYLLHSVNPGKDEKRRIQERKEDRTEGLSELRCLWDC